MAMLPRVCSQRRIKMSVFASNRKIVIDLASLNDYTDICDIMKAHRIITYVYEFCYNGEVIKYGLSADNSRNYGDRIYRQSGRLPGWKRATLVGPNGSEMHFINEDYKAKNGLSLNRHQMKITVTDLSKQTKADCEDLERYLIDTYINIHGVPPIGNKDIRTRFQSRKHHNTKHFMRFFDELA
jgi:hypothetical protein